MRKKYPYLEKSYTPFSDITPEEIEKNYPYVESPYNYNLNKEQEKEDFLTKIDEFVLQKQYVNITLLDWKENPIKEIQGIISSGSITKDGKSSVRRSANLSCSVSYGEYNIDSMEMDFALNKKVFIEIGVENKTNEYPEYPILWFPQGVFYINSFSMNSSTSSAVNLTLNLKDKMCLLNGDIGGKLPATVQFDTMTTQTSEGTMIEQKVLYYNIIMELLQHWGNEDLNNIIIQDVPLRIKEIVQWNGSTPIYLAKVKTEDSDTVSYQYSLSPQPGYSKYIQGDDIGYVYADFVPTGEITGAAGNTICSVLDTIKNQLGNYEYFYDVFGIFHFREIKNYTNINQSEIVLQETENPGRYISLEKGQFNLDTAGELQYLVDITNDKSSFSFDDVRNITSITVTPNYNNIKNDFVVNGIQKSGNIQMFIRYRLVIDNKPEIIGYTNKTHDALSDGEDRIPYYGVFHDLIYYTRAEYDGIEDNPVLETNVLGKWIELTELPKVGNMDMIYKVDNKFYIWSDKWRDVYLKNGEEKIDPEIYDDYYATDWRTYLLCYGLEASVNGTDPGPYYSDLVSFWPDEYDLRRENQKFFGENEDGEIHYKSLTTGNFYFDMIDASSSSLGIYSVENIGRRAEVINDNNVNCLFTPEIPDVIFLNMNTPSANWSDNTTITELRTIKDIDNALEKQKQECINNGQSWIQVPEDIWNSLIIGGYLNGAYESIRYALFSHTAYQKTLSISGLPVPYLEPNTRAHVSSMSTNTFGDFMIQSINLNLGPGANMSTTMSEALERL